MLNKSAVCSLESSMQQKNRNFHWRDSSISISAMRFVVSKLLFNRRTDEQGISNFHRRVVQLLVRKDNPPIYIDHSLFICSSVVLDFRDLLIKETFRLIVPICSINPRFVVSNLQCNRRTGISIGEIHLFRLAR